MFVNLIGIIAAFCTTLAFLPQTLSIIRTKNANGVSLSMYSIFNIGVLLWLIYGIMMNSLPIILANLITFGFAFTILVLKLRYK